MGGGGGFILGTDLTTPLNNSPNNLVGIEPGLYSPQLGGNIVYNLLFYDATDFGVNFKWPWE